MKIEKRSGSYSARIYVNGKQVRITAPTRAKLLQAAADYKCNDDSMSLGKAARLYLNNRAELLSPTTLKGYESAIKGYEAFIDHPLSSFTNDKVQAIVNNWANSLTPKTVCNYYGLLKAILGSQDIDIKVTLPKPVKPQLNTPTDNDIKLLLNYFKDTEMELIILFAAYIPMRRGEICALTWDDVKDNKVRINKTMIYVDHQYIIKNSPKSYAGYRTVQLPEIITRCLSKYKRGSGRIFSLHVNNITYRFEQAVKKLKLKHIRFHDLRHYGASKLHAIGIPDKYIIKRGGWETENIMRRIYQDTIEEDEMQFNKLLDQKLDQGF